MKTYKPTSCLYCTKGHISMILLKGNIFPQFRKICQINLLKQKVKAAKILPAVAPLVKLQLDLMLNIHVYVYQNIQIGPL